ncbi:beta strand repeat-containing protein [Pararhizobium gei]|uniref:beta strand repeat-containing protein n=1 Tax=Pararhizobium gei TaxID=1395951 RepID=UPI0023D99EA5|nr:calcium-binding protein [Rhizobium gei]
MTVFTGTSGGDTANAPGGVLVGFAGGTLAQLQDFIGDTISGGSGTDFISAGEAGDLIEGGFDGDTIFGNGGNDTIYAASAADPSASGVGDTLDGGSGSDLIFGSGGDDLIFGGFSTDTVNGGGGNDTIAVREGEFIDEVNGGGDVDTLDLSNITSSGGAAVIDLGAGTWDLSPSFGGPASINSVEIIIGTELGDSLTTGFGTQTLNGGGGNDTFFFLEGRFIDEVNGGSGINTLDLSDITTNGGGSINLDTGIWDLSPSYGGPALISGIDVVIGTQLNDTITTTFGTQTLSGGGGDDLFIMLEDRFIDAVDGGSGSDLLDLSNITSDGGASINMLTGTWDLSPSFGGPAAISGVEKVIGTQLDDTIVGDGADNVLSGSAGVDSLTGGGGNDIFGVDVFNDKVIEAIGGGNDRVVSTTSYTLAGGQEIEILQLAISTGTLALNVTGNEFGNELIGNAGSNTIKGAGGNDILRGGGGNDTYVVTDLGDTVFESVGGGSDTIVSTVSFELASGQEIESLRLAASTGTAALNLKGNQFNNELTGNSGINLLTGGAGNDTMSGGNGDDTYVVSEAGDLILEATGNGTDTVVSTTSYSLSVNQYVEVLRLAGSTGNTAFNLTGNNIGQQLLGNSGANTLNGGNGNDSLIGAGGNDTFYFNTTLSAVNNVDTIIGFGNAVGNSDVIALKNTIFTLLPAGALAASMFKANATGTATDANDYIVYNTTTGKLSYDSNGNGAGGSTHFATLDGQPSLTASDFLIV